MKITLLIYRLIIHSTKEPPAPFKMWHTVAIRNDIVSQSSSQNYLSIHHIRIFLHESGFSGFSEFIGLN